MEAFLTLLIICIAVMLATLVCVIVLALTFPINDVTPVVWLAFAAMLVFTLARTR